ncbi:MAG: hypothetical protein Q8O57_00085, partial [Kiritimatiellota bacterium]|nr:hypothetical protein [Kiritimatiellota bacterium]
MRSWSPIILALVFIVPAISLWAAGSKISSAAAVKALIAAPTRVVWCQDAGNGSDAGVEGNQLRLMGFNTEDGRGERAILSKPSNYAKPLLTPRGDRVIFSNRQEQKIYAVNWDGSG